MKKLLTLIMVLVLALSLFACKTKDPEPQPTPDPVIEWNVEDALAYLESYYEDESTTTPDDYEVLAQIIIGNATYAIDWTVEGSDKVTIEVADGKVTVNLDEKSPEDYTYTLKATIKAGDNTTATYTRECNVPKYELISFEQYMQATQDQVVTVKGIVVAINSKAAGNTRNHLFLADTEVTGGYYSYQMEKDPVADLGIEVGMTVTVTGPVTPYSGMQEIKGGTAKIVDKNKTTVAPLDITAAFAAGESLANYVALPVTIKGVTIGTQVLGGSSDYLYFELNGQKAYVRSYLTDFPTTLTIVKNDAGTAVSSPDKTAIEEAHAAKFGWTANVSGILVLYSGAPYLIPTSVDCFEYLEFVEKTAEEKIATELENLTVDASFSSDKVIDLLLTGKYYSDVTLTWESDSEYAVVADGKLTITIPEEGVTATVTVTATCGEASATKEFNVKLSKSLTSIADAIEIAKGLKDKGDPTSAKYLIAGIITEIKQTSYGNMYITDSNGNTIYIYGLYDAENNRYDAMANKPVVGDYIVVNSVIGHYNEPQLKSATLVTHIQPITIPEANEIGAAQTTDYTTDKYVVTGVVTEIANTIYGNVYITDADGNKIYLYGLYNEAGVRYDALAVKPAVGDTITVMGVLGQYKGTPQFKNATLVAHTVAATDEPENPEEPEIPEEPAEPTEGVKLTVDSLGLPSQSYNTDASTATVDGVGFEFIQLGNYGDGIQMRDKDGKTSLLWNTTAFNSAIVRIELVYSSTKNSYDNADAVVFTFGNAVGEATYTTKLSTVAGVKTYTITPDAETYTFFKLEHDCGYTLYWESITFVLADGTEVNPDEPNEGDDEFVVTGTGTDADPYMIIAGDYTCDFRGGLNLVWYSYTAKSSGYLTVSTTFATPWLKVGSDINTAQSNEGVGNSLKVYVLAGATVMIGVADWNEQVATIPFTVSFETFVSDPIDSFVGEWVAEVVDPFFGNTNVYTLSINADSTGTFVIDSGWAMNYEISYIVVNGANITVAYTGMFGNGVIEGAFANGAINAALNGSSLSFTKKEIVINSTISAGKNNLSFTEAEITADTATRPLTITVAGDYTFAAGNLFVAAITAADGNAISRNDDYTYTLAAGEYTVTFSMLSMFGVEADTACELVVEIKPAAPAVDYNTTIVSGNNVLYFSEDEITADTATRPLTIAVAGNYTFAAGNLYVAAITATDGTVITINGDYTYTLAAGEYTVTFGMLSMFGVVADEACDLNVTDSNANAGDDDDNGNQPGGNQPGGDVSGEAGTIGNPIAIETLPLEIKVTGNHDLYYVYTATNAVVLKITYTEGGLVTIEGATYEKEEDNKIYTVTVAAGATVTINPWTMNADGSYTYVVAVAESDTSDTPVVPVTQTYSYEFTAKVYEANETKTLNNVDWTLAGEGGNYWGYDTNNGRGQQFGSGSKPYTAMTFTSASFNGVTKIVVNTSGAKDTNATLTVKVNGVEVGTISLTSAATDYTFELASAVTGEIVLSYAQTSSKAIYIKSISVTYA